MPKLELPCVRESIEPYNAKHKKQPLSLDERLLEFCEQPRSRQEIIDFLGFSRFYSMSKIVQPLLDAHKLALTMPDKPKSSKQRYVKVI